jgi:hypothetical protein
MHAPPPPHKRPLGCLPRLALYLVLGFILIMALDLAFEPWIYVVGGRIRLFPVWVGSGVAQSPGGPYTIYLWFSPAPSGSRSLPSAGIEGGGWICTPQGRRYSLRVSGGAPGRIWNDMDGHRFLIGAVHRPFAWQYNREDRRPRLSLSGQWVGPNLVMNDEGSITRAFHPDGTLKSYRDSLQPGTAVLPIVLQESRSWFSTVECRTP